MEAKKERSASTFTCSVVPMGPITWDIPKTSNLGWLPTGMD
jgi:hypothetical protein